MPKVTKNIPVVSIFIPTGSRPKELKRVLTSLTKQSFKDFEVIIVDYKSGQDVFKLIDQFSKKLHITVINQIEKGLVKAANLALQKARGKYFIRTDDDVEMTPKWLESIVQTFQKDKKVGGVTGPTIIPEENLGNRDIFLPTSQSSNQSIFWKTIGSLYNDYFLEKQSTRVSHWFDSGAFSIGSNFPSALKEPLQEVSNLEACNFAVRKDVLKSLGGFDEIFAGVGDYHEADAALKVKEAGYTLIFNPKAQLFHLPSQEGFFNDRPSSYQRMINFIIFYMRHLKPNTLRKLVRFSLYILFQDGYYVYQAIHAKQLNQLGALVASITGFYEYFKTIEPEYED